jgi:hypothetical protein
MPHRWERALPGEHELISTMLPALLDCVTAIERDLTAQPAVLTGTIGRFPGFTWL